LAVTGASSGNLVLDPDVVASMSRLGGSVSHQTRTVTPLGPGASAA
jgi:hypothetical protein